MAAPFDAVIDPTSEENAAYPESITHLKFKFYLYFRSFRSGSLATKKNTAEKDPEFPSKLEKDTRKVNSFRDGIQFMSEKCGTVDSPKAEEIDCAICQTCLKFKPNQNDSAVARTRCSGYYETPCLHVYHKQCLLEWLNVKLECPQCRSALPKPYSYDGAAASLFSDEEDEQVSANREDKPFADAENGLEMARQDRVHVPRPGRQDLYRLSSGEGISDFEQQRSVAALPVPNLQTENDADFDHRPGRTLGSLSSSDRIIEIGLLRSDSIHSERGGRSRSNTLDEFNCERAVTE